MSIASELSRIASHSRDAETTVTEQNAACIGAILGRKEDQVELFMI